MKLYSAKLYRHVERKIHFGIGQSVKTACGLVMFSRHIMVQVGSDFDGAIITENIERVTCKRCLSMRDTRLRKIMAIQSVNPGIFDRERLVSENWLMEHALEIKQEDIDLEKLELTGSEITLTNKNKPKDRKKFLHDWIQR